jgi:hypothetical protein
MILKNKSRAEVHLLAHRALEVIRARDTAIKRAHADRMGRLKELMREISVAEDGEANPDAIPGTQSLSLSPELERLILNPTEGL